MDHSYQSWMFKVIDFDLGRKWIWFWFWFASLFLATRLFVYCHIDLVCVLVFKVLALEFDLVCLQIYAFWFFISCFNFVSVTIGGGVLVRAKWMVVVMGGGK